MREFFGRFIVGSLPGIVAAGIAITVTWVFFDNYSKDHKRPCSQKPCFVELSTRITQTEERLTKLEASKHPSTSKRFNSDDALAMELRMIKCHNRDDWQKCLVEERLKYERSKQ
jgi:hypothetical protein